MITTFETALVCYQLTLEVILEVMKGIPDDARAAAWARHEHRMEFLQGLIEKLRPSN